MLIIDGLQYSDWSPQVFSQMKTGGVNAVHVTITYHEDCVETLQVIGQWNRLFENYPDLIMPITCAEDIKIAQASDKIGIMYGFQNCSPIENTIDYVKIFRDLNVFFMQLTYNNQSPLATGCYENVDSGITRFGKQVIKEMNRVGMVVDMSHSAEKSTLEAIDISERPIVISHANPSSFHAALRNKSNIVLKALSESGGLLGFSLYPFHLKNGVDCTLSEFCQMVAKTAELIGVDSIGIGSDLCQNQPLSILEWMRNGRWSKVMDYGEGNTNNTNWPKPLPWFRDNRDFINIIKGLRTIGFSESELEKIMGLNWYQFIEQSIKPQMTEP
ncbi:MAG: membrane dipeptidase [Ostreibacterium sp.]